MIYIIGTGSMGGAIAKVLSQKGQRVLTYDKSKHFVSKNILPQKDFSNLGRADVIILAVKPYHFVDVAQTIQSKLKPSAVLVSIAAGLKIAKIQKMFGHKKVIRMMPNLGLAVGEGIAAWKSAYLNKAEKIKIQKLMNLFTENFEVGNEKQLDAVTAISGSGPAYFFFFADALLKAAISLGFNKLRARRLVEKTFSAAAALQRGRDYGYIIKLVASKKGTTERAIKSFQKFKLDKVVKSAVEACFKRAKEISNE